MKAKWMRQKLLSLVLVMVLLLQCLPAAALGQEGPTTSGPTVTGITVVQLPDKTTYLAGEELDLTGMVVQADFDDASTQIVEPETVEGFDSDPGTKTIVVSYQGYSDEFEVTVEAVEDSSSSSSSNAVQSVPKTLSNSNPNIAYQAHYSYKGWIDTVSNGQTAGSTSTASRLEALIITLPGATGNSNLRYRAHVAYVGWQDWTTGGNIMGTTGQSYRLEALQIELTGDISSTHDVYYRVYSTQQG